MPAAGARVRIYCSRKCKQQAKDSRKAARYRNDPTYRRGLCNKHYYRSKRLGSESRNAVVILNGMASLHGAFAPKVKTVKAKVTVGVMAYCPACGECMLAPSIAHRVCSECCTEVWLNEEEVSWLASEMRSKRASLQMAS